MDASRSDVLILGGGVIGLASAYYLLRAGATVRVLEQGTPGCGSSHGNCGTITPSHAAPLAMPGMVSVALRSMFRADAPLYLNPRPDPERLRWLLGFARRCNWRDFERATRARSAILQRSRGLLEALVRDEALDCEFVAGGELYVYRTRAQMEADERHHAQVLDRLGIEVNRLRGDEVENLEPALLPGVAGGLFHPGDAQLRPNRYAAELARRVRELGGEVVEGVEATSLEVERGTVVGARTAQGTESARDVIVALGPWTARFLAPHGLDLPIQPGKGYSQTYSKPSVVPNMVLETERPALGNTAGEGVRYGPCGMLGGKDGAPHRYRLLSEGRPPRELRTKEVGIALRPGDCLEIRSSGGGGWGPPEKRTAEARRHDEEQGLTSGLSAELKA